MEIRESTVRAGDIDVECRSVGEGTPLVVVHGGPGIGHGYLRGLDHWADEFRVIYYDQRGSGNTPLGDVSRVSFAGGIEDLDALRRGLGIERLNLVGHSFGGLLALMYAATHPERTGSLTLIATAPPVVPELQQRLWTTMAARRRPEDDAEKQAIEASTEFAVRDPKTVERYFVNMYLPFFRDRANAASLDMGFTANTAENAPAAWDRTFVDLEALDPIGALTKIACPTLVVHCELDPVPEEFSRLLADKIAGARYAYVPGVNHFAHHEDPERLASAVRPFLRQHAV